MNRFDGHWLSARPAAIIALLMLGLNRSLMAQLPVITAEPLPQTTNIGTNVTFAVGATSASPPAYQWYFDGGPLAGATAPALTLNAVQTSQSGNYTVAVTNPSGMVFSSPSAPGYVSSTLVGAVNEYIGIDGPVSTAAIGTPKGAAVDAAGNIYVADYGDNAIRKITPGGVVTTLAGQLPVNGLVFSGSADGAGSIARFKGPSGLAVDAAGNIYVADSGNSTIRKITPAGLVTTLAGQPGTVGSTDGTGSAAQFSSPTGVAVDASGNVYVADYGNDTIRKISTAGVVTTFAGQADVSGSADGAGAAARFSLPKGVAVDSSGNVYVADWGNGTIRTITPGGVVATLAGQARSYGNVDGSGSAARFEEPAGIVVDGAGNIYVADQEASTIRKISPAGVVTTLGGQTPTSGNTNGSASVDGFNAPTAVGIDVYGQLSIADTGNNEIRVLTPTMLNVVSVLPSIATQPLSQTVAAGSRVMLAVSATGMPAPTYQWYFDGTAISGASSASYTIGSAQAATMGDYTVDVANGSGSVTSNVATLTVTPVAAPTITMQPQSQTVVFGSSAVFTAGVSGATSFQWLFNGIAISGATSGTLTLSGSAIQAGSYSVYAANSAGSVTSSLATLMVAPALAISSARTATGYVGVNFLYTISAAYAPTGFFISGSLPPGCSLNPSTGIISGSPSAAGTYAVTIGADNATTAVTAALAITIYATPPITWNASTLAGSAYSSGSADGTGANARFSIPLGITVDANDNVYVADTGNDTIRKITPGGMVTTLAGSGLNGGLDGTGIAAEFNSPSAIVVDGSGNLFVADTNSSTIRKITPAGVVTTIAGFPGLTGTADGAGNAARFNKPMGIAIDPNGTLYIADTGNGLIREMTSSGVVTTVVTAPNPWLIKPYGIAVDGTDTISVWDSASSAIVRIAPSGSVSLLATLPTLQEPFSAAQLAMGGLALDAAGNAYILFGVYNTGADLPILNAQLFQITPSGLINSIYYWNSSGISLGQVPFSNSTGVAVDSAGKVFLTGYDSVITVASAAAPAISVQPQNQSGAVGGNVTFAVIATGTPAPTYQWQFNGANLAGATSSTLTLTNLSLAQAGSYTAAVSNASSTATSNAASLNLTEDAAGPSYVVQPQSLSVNAGTSATFSASATGSGLSFQWLENGIAIPGATGSTYTIPSAQAGNDGIYSVAVSNTGGSVASAPAYLGVNVAPGATYLNSWSDSRPLLPGTPYTSAAFDGSAFLAAGTDGSLFLSSNATTWSQIASAPGQLNSLIYAGAPYGMLGVGNNGIVVSFAAPTYAPVTQISSTSNLLTGIAVGDGRMVAVGYGGTAISSGFSFPNWITATTGTANNLNAIAYGNSRFVAVGLGATVLTSPDGLEWSAQTLGSSADLYSIAYGPAGFVAIGDSGPAGVIFTSPDGITWTPEAAPATAVILRVVYANGTFIAVGASGAIFTSTDGGFTWVARNSGTTSTLEGVAYGLNEFVVVGNSGTVAQSAPAAVRIGNISTRAFVGTGSNSLIAGFITAGTGPKEVLIRGIGPTLSEFDVSGPLANPQLTLFNGASQPIATNADWAGSAALSTVFTQVGAFALPTTSADTAMVQSLAPGSYTAQVSSANGSAGVALAEVYDADTGTPASRLVNISTRAYVGTGANVMIAGFVISGNNAETVLIRGIGPGLSTFGVTGLLSTPVLTLYDGLGNVVATNTAWGGTAALTNAFTQAGAFSLSPTSNDTALLVALPPGTYTAQVSGAGNATGVALVEVYEVQ